MKGRIQKKACLGKLEDDIVTVVAKTTNTKYLFYKLIISFENFWNFLTFLWVPAQHKILYILSSEEFAQ